MTIVTPHDPVHPLSHLIEIKNLKLKLEKLI